MSLPTRPITLTMLLQQVERLEGEVKDAHEAYKAAKVKADAAQKRSSQSYESLNRRKKELAEVAHELAERLKAVTE